MHAHTAAHYHPLATPTALEWVHAHTHHSHADHHPNACDHSAAYGLLLGIVHLIGAAAVADETVVHHQDCEDHHCH